MKKISYLTIVIILFQSSKCNDCTIKALPDLFAKAIELGQKPGGFTSGDIVPLGIAITNLIDATNTCPTQEASSTEYETALLHRPNSNASWSMVGKANYGQPTIEAGGTGFSDNPKVKFTVPGDYYVTDLADALQKITERSRTNNTNVSQPAVGVRSSTINTSNIEFITVKSTKEFEDKVQRKEKINYVEFLPKDNLKSVQLFQFQ